MTKEEVVTGTMTVGEVEHSLKLTCKPDTLAIQVLYTNIVHTYIVHMYTYNLHKMTYIIVVCTA